MIRLEADFSLPERIDEPVMFGSGDVGLEPALDDGEEAPQLLLVLVALPCPFDGGGQFVE